MRTISPLLSIAVLSSSSYSSAQRADHVCKEYYTLMNTVMDIFVQAQEGKITADEAAKTSTPLIEKTVELRDLMWKIAKPDGIGTQPKDETQYNYLVAYFKGEEAKAIQTEFRKKVQKIGPYFKDCQHAALKAAMLQFREAVKHR